MLTRSFNTRQVQHVLAIAALLLFALPCCAQFSFKLDDIARLELSRIDRATLDDIVSFSLTETGRDYFQIEEEIVFDRTEGFFFLNNSVLRGSSDGGASAIAFAYDEDGFRISNFGAEIWAPNRLGYVGTWELVPEPSSFAMSGFAMIGWMLVRRRTR